MTTLSIHAESNFPFRKCAADFDVSLPDKTADREYLAELDKVLLDAMRNANPELVIYTSGADPFEGDRLGRLSVSKNGLQSRDRMVFSRCHDRSVPVAVTMAGGYANNVEDIVDIHESTVAQALELYQRRAANA